MTLAAVAPSQEWGARDRLFSLPRSQDDIFEWRRAKEDLAAGRVLDGIERLQALLSYHRGGIAPADPPGDRFLGLRAAVLETMRGMSADAQATYDKIVGRDAPRLLRRALVERRSADLEALANDYPVSTGGRAARLLLGDLALDSGQGIAAEYHYRALLDALPDDGDARAMVRRRMHAARVVSGSWSQPSTDPELRRVAAEIREVLPSGSSQRSSWDAYGGGGDGARLMQPVLGRPRLQSEANVRAPGFRGRMAPMHAVGDLSGVYVNNGQTLFSFDPLAKEPSTAKLWVFDGPLAGDPEADEYEASINRNMVLAAACGPDTVVAALQVPNDGQNTRFQSIDVMKRIPRRRLFACDRSTGKLKWRHWDHPGGAVARRFAGHDAAGPPTIHGNTVYVATHDQTGAIAYYLAAYDLETGAPRWRQLICSSQGEVNMFGNSRREYAASPLAISAGVVYGVTHLGVVFAADADSGAIRWITPYQVIPMPQTRLTDQRDRTTYFANNPVAITDGMMACAPIDSQFALGIDCESGRVAWRLPYLASARQRNDVRWLLGVIGDEFIFSGLGVIGVKARPTARRRGLEAQSRSIRSPQSLGLTADLMFPTDSVPRGAIADGLIYHASPGGIRVFSKRGESAGADLATPEFDFGNLLLTEGALISLRDGSMQVYFDVDKLTRDAEKRARDNKDPAAILRLAALTRAEGVSAERAEKLYQRGLDLAKRSGLGPRSPIYRRLAVELFQVTRERALELRRSAPREAISVMRRARDHALLPQDWLTAQVDLLRWLGTGSSEFEQELDVMSKSHGTVMHDFPEIGRVPVAVYVLWERARSDRDPQAAMASSQELLERFGDLHLGDVLAREFARARQRELVASHGRAVYRSLEERAQRALADAAGDPDRLRSLAQRFPLSDAAQQSIRLILDHAVERGDLAAAVASYAQARGEGQTSASLYRRMMVAAEVAGNPPLARAFATELLADHGDEPSDYGPDNGQRFTDCVSLPVLPPAPRPVPVGRPLEIVATRMPESRGSGLRICRLQIAAGFANPPVPPLYLSAQGRRLEAFDLSEGADLLAEPLFSVPHNYHDGEDLLLCASTLVVPESERVRGIEFLTGEEKWSVAANSSRMFHSLGCQRGVLHVFSEHKRAADGGALFGIEPITGAIMFQIAFPRDAESIPPVSSGGALWLFDPGSESVRPEIRRLNALTGAVDRRIPLKDNLLEDTGLADADRRIWRTHTLHQMIVADERGVYLPVDGDDHTPPRVAAIDLDGRERWLWRGTVGRDLAMCALHGNDLVIIERSASVGSRLVVLDASSRSVRKDATFRGHVSIRNWERSERSEPAPDQLLLVEREQRALQLVCYSLDNRVPTFRYGLPSDYQQIAPRPLLGADFIAFPTWHKSGAVDVFVLDLERRRGALEGGAAHIRLSVLRPFRLASAGPFVVMQSAEGISLFGDGTRSTGK